MVKDLIKSTLALIGAAMLISCTEQEEVDLIVHNAQIYTVNETFDIAEAMAVRGDEILEIGPEHQILNKYRSSNVLDAKNQFIYPGFIDAHSHFTGYAKTLAWVDLTGVQSEEEMIDRVLEYSKNNSGNFILGRGWDQTEWASNEYPNNAWCDSLLSDRFICLKRVDGHAALVSSNLLEKAGIDFERQFEGGEVMTKNGHTTGVLIDNAMDPVQDLIDTETIGNIESLLQKAQQNCFSVGLTSVSDAGLDLVDIERLRSMASEGKLALRLYLMLNPNQENFDHYLGEGPFQNDQISISSFKFYCDGALGSRGALLKRAYEDVDDSTYTGLRLTDEGEMRKRAKEILDNGFQMNTHAIGDRGVELMLDIYGAVLSGTNDHRWRIEHAQVVDPIDIDKFRTFNIIPSVQPTHATSDMNWAEDRLGASRIQHAYAYKSLLEQNGMIALGTDFPVEKIDPLLTLLAAVNRVDISGHPQGGYFPEESLSFEECLRGMTIWAALANFEEAIKGSLEVGKKADFVVFNRDLKELDANNLNSYKVTSTYLGGRKVYSVEQ